MWKKIFRACLLAGWCAAGVLTAAPADSLSRYEFTEPHMGTLWHVTLYAPDEATAREAVGAAFARVAALDEVMTDYDPESELMRLSRSPRGVPVRVSDDLFDILKRSQELSVASGGAFDVTVGPLVQLWRRARRQRELPAADRLAAARRTVGFANLVLDERKRTATLLADGMRLDLGAIAKGFGADAALQVLRTRGLSRSLVAASGDLAIGDPPPGKTGCRVGIGLPGVGETNLASALLLSNAGVSTSGDAEQYVELGGRRYSHIIDPRTGQALTNRIQVTIVADCATRSDALATTVCVLGPEEGLRLVEACPKAAACVVLPGTGPNHTVLTSTRFPASRNPNARLKSRITHHSQ
jgi:FAD:protein FMN transferase